MKFLQKPIWLFVLGTFFTLLGIAAERYGNRPEREVVLIANAQLLPPFDQSLVLVKHGWLGARGVILNKPLSGNQKSQLPGIFANGDIEVSYGGPVEFPEKIYVLKWVKAEQAGETDHFVIGEWETVLKQDSALPDKIRQDQKNGALIYRVFAGCAGWGIQQLEGELAGYGWFTAAPTHDLIFQKGNGVDWDTLYQQQPYKPLPGQKA
ncbi:MAG: YqgE/AlgH family protein [Alphaproteobacteria bacterium]